MGRSSTEFRSGRLRRLHTKTMTGGPSLMAGRDALLLHDREQWGRESDFIFTIINLSVGFSNVCSFPFLVYDNGGVVFLGVYALLVATMGVPLLYLEIFLGQFCGSSMPDAFGGFPLAKGIGWTMVYMAALMSVYRTPFVAYSLIYLAECFSQQLPWASCPASEPGASVRTDNSTVSNISAEGCYEITNRKYPCARVNSTLVRRYLSGNYSGPAAVAVQDTAEGPVVAVPLTEYLALRNDCVNGNLSSEEYHFQRDVLNLSSSIAELGSIQTVVVVSMLVYWLLAYFSIFNGARSLGRVSTANVQVMVALLVLLCAASLTLSGAFNGIAVGLQPDLHKLLELKTWYLATRHLFYSINLALGTSTCLASYNDFQTDIFR
ncbi:sodium- and chloride-dependent neutral and basic amino acid transporter B(0+)-like [Haemaphysalis longicornis]